MSFTSSEIKEEELKLLEISGFCLAQYGDSYHASSIFKDLPINTTIKELQRLQATRLKSAGFSSNANLKAIASILLSSIYSQPIKQDLLDYLKSALYNPKIDLTSIKHHPLPGLTNGQMKKLAVEFFYSLIYSQVDDRVQSKLSKYPVILEILTLFLRCILAEQKLKNADNYIFRLPTKDIYHILIDYFDLNCRNQAKFFLFYEDRIFILENQHGQILVGNYIQNQTQKTAGTHTMKKTMRFSSLSEVQQDYENQGSRRPLEMSNRSLQIRGIVSESIVFEHEAPTPFFNFDQESHSSFQNSKEASLAQQKDYQKESLMRMSRQMSLLKKMDRNMTTSQQIGLGSNLNMKRTIIQNELKASLQCKDQNLINPFGMVLDSPITLDSPHTLSIPADKNFEQQVQQQRGDRKQIKMMKKSKSQRMSKTMPEIDNIDLSQKGGINKDHSTTQQQNNEHQTARNGVYKKQRACYCVTNKKKKMKLNSHLYQINMSYVQSVTTAFSKKTHQFYEIPSEQTNLSGEMYLTQDANNYSQFSNKKIAVNESARANRHLIETSYLNESINSCSIRATNNPQSDTYSRRQYSPLSNIDRSFSPFGGTKSISSPRITFSYKNSLKYSTQLSNNKTYKTPN